MNITSLVGLPGTSSSPSQPQNQPTPSEPQTVEAASDSNAGSQSGTSTDSPGDRGQGSVMGPTSPPRPNRPEASAVIAAQIDAPAGDDDLSLARARAQAIATAEQAHRDNLIAMLGEKSQISVLVPSREASDPVAAPAPSVTSAP